MFKNLKIFVLSTPIRLENDNNQQYLVDNKFVPCTSLEQTKDGWISPFGKHSDVIMHQSSGSQWLMMQKEQKILPTSVINQAVEEKAFAHEQETGTPLSKKQIKDLKEDVTSVLLPKAFSKFSVVSGVVNDEKQLLWVDAASDGKAEEFCSLLRTSIGSLPISLLNTEVSPTVTMTNWLLNNELPEDIVLEDEAELRDTAEDGGIIRCKQQLLNDPEILAHIEAGKQVAQLRVTWDETLSCTICSDLTIKRIRFTDTIIEQNQDLPPEDKAAKTDADFTLMSGELNRFILRLMDIFGYQPNI